MKDIQNFISKFFQAELDARNAYIKPDVAFALKQLEIFHSYSINLLHNKYGITKNGIPDEDLYEAMEGVEYDQLRQLFKISQYKNKKHGNLYLAYASNVNPLPRIFRMFECFFIAKIGGEFKVIQTALFSSGEGEIPYWSLGSGDEDISFDSAGQFVATERFLEPKNDPYSMEEYKKDQ